MGQQISGVAGRGLPSNGYDARCQLHPEELMEFLKPLYKSLLHEIGYVAAVSLDPDAVAKLHKAMQEKADATGLDYIENTISSVGFNLGLSLACLCYPGHPIEVQAYIGIFTWLAILIEDRIIEVTAEVEGYQRRFFAGEEQPTPLLRAHAAVMKETWNYWDPILANMIVTATLEFVSSNLLDTRTEFQDMVVTKAGTSFPYFFRHMAGVTVAYGIFSYPKSDYPELGLFLEALPDMALYVNIINDVLSFYKEEGVGETQNYIHNRAKCEQKDPLVVLEKVKAETVACVERIRLILKDRPHYLESWERQVMGMISMHTVNPGRYRLADLGLGEEHPIKESLA